MPAFHDIARHQPVVGRERGPRAPSPRRRHTGKLALISVLAGAVFGMALPAVASWMVTSEGTAGGSLGALKEIKVDAVHDGEFLPGQDMVLKAELDNPNPVELRVAQVTVKELTTDKEGCKIARGLFHANEDLTVKAGKSSGVNLGKLELPKSLDQDCMGAKVTVRVSVATEYGS